MKTCSPLALLTTLFLASFCPLYAQEVPKMPSPVTEHEWLKKLVGEWESSTEIQMEPGKPPLKAKGTETVRPLGGFWIISEGQGEVMGNTMQHRLTLGYDVAKGKYTGAWIDTMGGHLWIYEGTVDATGNILTLETEGPCPMASGMVRKFKEVTEFKGPDQRTFASSMLGDDGKWIEMVRGTANRKK